MRFALCAVALCTASAPAGAATVFSGTLNPIDGFVDFYRDDFVSALKSPSLKSFSLSLTNGVITEASIDADFAFAYDEYDEYEPGKFANSGNDYHQPEGCFFNSQNPDGCVGTFGPGPYTHPAMWLKDLSVGQRTLTFNVNQPRTYDVCTDPPTAGVCSYFWGGQIFSNVKIASYRPVNYTFTVETFGGAVPEPATWATMLAGFGLIGGLLRNRRARSLSHAHQHHV